MLDPQEVKQFQEIVQQIVKVEIVASEKRMVTRIKESGQRMAGAIVESEQRMIGGNKESEERMMGKLEESEQRMIGKIDGKIDQAIQASEKRTAQNIKQLGIEIGDFITKAVLPQIEEKASKVELKEVASKIQEHEAIFKKIRTALTG